jgi:hypothetical protein
LEEELVDTRLDEIDDSHTTFIPSITIANIGQRYIKNGFLGGLFLYSLPYTFLNSSNNVKIKMLREERIENDDVAI